MSESSSDQKIFGAKWAAAVGAALLVGLASISALAWRDHQRLSSIESTESNSAVGDTSFFPLPAETAKEQASPQAPLLKFGGKELFARKLKAFKLRDSQMFRQGMEDSKRFTIYSLAQPRKPRKGESPKTGEVFYFVKVAPGKYLKLSPEAPSSAASASKTQ